MVLRKGILAWGLVSAACAHRPVPPHVETALRRVDRAMETGDPERVAWAIYDLHDIDEPPVRERLDALLDHGSRHVRNVAALALGGQRHAPESAGASLLRAYAEHRDDPVIVASVLDSLRELRTPACWPAIRPTLLGRRLDLVTRTIDVIAAARAVDALPDLAALERRLAGEPVRAEIVGAHIRRCVAALRR